MGESKLPVWVKAKVSYDDRKGWWISMPEISEIPLERAEGLLRYRSVREWVHGKPPAVRTRRLRCMTALASQLEETPSGIIRLAKAQGSSALREMIAETPAHDRHSLIEFLTKNGVNVPEAAPPRSTNGRSPREIRSSRT